ncbi:MAG: glycosyltransferase family 4 protein [Candidatus Cloacimonetes bacterium]|nr:glycosyltransferase family 4 protein [Candidatus Cloacimonadota bacterium]
MGASTLYDKNTSVKPRIAVIGCKGLPAFGGSARVVESLIHKLHGSYDFTVYALSSHANQNGIYDECPQIVLKKLRHKKLSTLFYYFKATLHCLFVGNYDIVHVHHIDAAFIIPLLKLKYKVISTSHGITFKADKWSSTEKAFFRLMEIIYLKCPAHAMTTVAKSIQEQYQKRTKRHVHYIPNAVETDHGELPAISHQGYIFFAAGRILRIKGLHTLLQALGKMQFDGKIIVAGDLNQDQEYKKRIERLSEGLPVTFTGLIKDQALLMSYIEHAQLFVFPSTLEAMSSMLLEAASLDTPIVCSDIPENMDVFSDDEVLLFKNDNAEDLQQKLEWALDHPEEMAQKAKQARKKLAEVFNWDVVAAQYDHLYKRMLP